MMKQYRFKAVLLATFLVAVAMVSSAATVSAAAFVVKSRTDSHRRVVNIDRIVGSGTSLFEAVELEPEPEGGEEMKPAKSSLPDCRMKKMERVPDVTSDSGDVHKFWMTAVADGTLIKETRTKLLKESSKKANFPGFRKVWKHFAPSFGYDQDFDLSKSRRGSAHCLMFYSYSNAFFISFRLVGALHLRCKTTSGPGTALRAATNHPIFYPGRSPSVSCVCSRL